MKEYDISNERLSTLDGKPISPWEENPDPLPITIFQHVEAIDYLVKKCNIRLTEILWLEPHVIHKILSNIQTIETLHEHRVSIETLSSPILS